MTNEPNLNLEDPNKDVSSLIVKRWDWRDNTDLILSAEKSESDNHLNCYLDKNKNNSKAACYYAYNTYGLTNVYDVDESLKIKNLGVGFIYSKKAAYNYLGLYQEENKPYIYMDNGYFSKFYDVKTYKFRMIVNNIHPQIDVDGEYETKSNIEMLPWRERSNAGLYILICPPTNNPQNNILKSFGLKKTWLYNTIKSIRKKTDRKILIRFKNYNYNFVESKQDVYFSDLNKQFGNISYKQEISDANLLDLFEKCYAVVAPASGVGVIAATKGIPVFSESFGPVSSIATHDYSLINDPIYPDRGRWINNILSHEFLMKDIYSGEWIARLKKMYPLELEDILSEKINLF